MKSTRFLFAVLLLSISLISLSAQETRSALLGTVRDSAGAVVAGATVAITNTETNSNTTLTTNDSGYFEAPYLLPATYTITVTATGFKTYVQRGFALSVNSRANVDISLEIGATSDYVQVTASAPLLETTTGSGTASLEQRQIKDLPVMSNSAILLARSTPGMQWTAQPNYLGMHSNAGGSAISAVGGVGGNEYSLDGVPNFAEGRRTGYLPYTDTIAEFKVETAPFDASKGHTTSATVSLSTKSGTNSYHGQLTWQHWQQRLNATQSTTNAGYWSRIRQAEGAGNTALAEQLRSESPQPPGRSNNWAGSAGGPVRIPKLYNGKDKLFFFFAYNAAKDVKTEEATAVNRTVPTDKQRIGDFSELLAIDPRYRIYDPRTAKLVTGGACGNNSAGVPITCVVRQPFPDITKIPILNPMYKFYEPLFPRANNVPGVVSNEFRNNYLASATPFNWDYRAFTNRVDLQLTSKQRMFGKWSYSNFNPEDRGDWVYETKRGLLQNGLVRKNIGITFDHVYTFNSTTIFNWSVAWNRFIEGSASNEVQTSFRPSTVGLPSYVDDKADPYFHLPNLDFSDGSYSEFNRSFPGFGRFSVGTIRGELSKYIGTHSVRFGVDMRQNWRATNGPGNSAGTFSYNNSFVRQTQNTTNAGVLGLEWAAFMLGVPNGVSIASNDDLFLSNKFYSGYVQDDWKLNRKLTLNFGLRYELEGGFRERFNRGLTGFDLESTLPISQAAQEAYAKLPASILALRPASDFIVKGGSTYLGENGAPDTVNKGQPGWMPRVGFAYQINDATVLRGGWGMFYDTTNVLNNGLNQTGYNDGTGTTITNDNGLTFLGTNITSPECQADVSACRNIFGDPFPVRADGTRFDVPVGNALGLMALQGRAISYSGYDWKRARQHRFRIGLQRQIGNSLVIEVAYLGSRTDLISVEERLSVLPEKYWATGLIRNNALANDLNSNVTNPFRLSNFAALQTTLPLVYQDMSTQGFFTNANIAKHTLLRPWPNLAGGDGLRNSRIPTGKQVYNHLELTATKRFSQGYSLQASYLWVSNIEHVTRENEFDDSLVRRPTNNSAPHSLNVSLIYEFPFGKGRKWLSGNKWLSALVGGWQIGGIYNKQSGRVFDLGNWFYYGNDLRDIAKDTKDQTPDEWFNWQLFPGASRDFNASDRSAYEARLRAIVPESVLQQMGNICGSGNNPSMPCTYATAVPDNFRPNSFHTRIFPTRLNWLRGHGKNQIDANLLRRFEFKEGRTFEFRLDLINAFNHVLWDLPNNDIGSSNFGRVTTQWNTPRFVQFQLRLVF